MKFVIDHDFHIHSFISLCSHDPEQTPGAILSYAKENGLGTVVLTDHYWDEAVPGTSSWYQRQNYAHIAEALPLPQTAGVRFLFGCETDIDRFLTLGISREAFDLFDFVVIPTTHLHMNGFTVEDRPLSCAERAGLYVTRLSALLDMPLPFSRIGIAHLTCPLIDKSSWEAHLAVIDAIPDETFAGLFARVREKGAGVELNMPIMKYSDAELDRIFRPYRIAKAAGCKFYLGSDAHKTRELKEARAGFERMIDLLDLSENDKFRLPD